MQKRSVYQINNIVKGEIVGDQNFLVSNISSIEDPRENSIVFLRAKKYAKFPLPYNILLITTKKLSSYINSKPKSIIYTEDLDKAIINILNEFYPPRSYIGISEKAILKEDVQLGKDIYIGDNVIIESGVILGDKVKIFPGVYVGRNVHIGDGTVIHPRAVILDKVKIGKNCIIQSGAVLGEDGFGFSEVDGRYVRIPQVGKLIIEDNVEIGALSVIDRGALSNTVIKKGTKIDALVKIAHNVVLGENNIITAQVGIAGSSKTGNNVKMGGQSGIADHISVGDNVVIAADSGVISDIPSGAIVSGSPAVDHMKDYRAKFFMYQLPDLVKKIKKIEKELDEIKGE